MSIHNDERDKPPWYRYAAWGTKWRLLEKAANFLGQCWWQNHNDNNPNGKSTLLRAYQLAFAPLLRTKFLSQEKKRNTEPTEGSSRMMHPSWRTQQLFYRLSWGGALRDEPNKAAWLDKQRSARMMSKWLICNFCLSFVIFVISNFWVTGL